MRTESEPKACEHVLDRLILKVLSDEAGDQLGAPIWSAVARIAAEEVRGGIKDRRRARKPISDELAWIEQMSTESLEKLCMDRIRVLTHRR